ncbi:MAG TPA: potassium transporter Kup [Phycisphaerae bacterium]|nr:potassium transporter Kup [Phycisphaerae bacterium]
MQRDPGKGAEPPHSAFQASPGVPGSHSPAHAKSRRVIAALTLGALGVVYGDIGTSPLYALRECFREMHGGLAPTPHNVLGLLSLFFWSLMLVVVLKYLGFVLRADNRGEGGILSLMALAVPQDRRPTTILSARTVIVSLGLFGAALLFSDGMITPAISVLSAVEGLQLATPVFQPYILPLTVSILVGLFVVQRYGTGFMGALFGPAMLVWFITIGVLGLRWIIREPVVLTAVNPLLAVQHFWEHGLQGFLVLGAVVLCITGAEALYADLGHFGRLPIKLAWFTVAFPGLLLNYFGQGAIVIAQGATAAANPFYALGEGYLHYPLVILATVAAVIASQAMISGAYSIAQQAVQLGYSPRLTIVHTSRQTKGQIFLPEINFALMVACCGLVVTFQASSDLAAAYGVAVTSTMTVTSLLLFVVARRRWNWPLWKAGGLIAFFLVVDLGFFSSNVMKVFHGGWFPLAVAIVVYTLMSTWKRGRSLLGASLGKVILPLSTFLDSLAKGTKPVRVPGTAVFMTSNPDGTPVVLMHHYKHNKVLHERIILLSVTTLEVPYVAAVDRVKVRELGQGFFQVRAHYGYMQTPRVADVFRCAEPAGLKVDPTHASFYLGRETLITTRRPGMSRWRKKLFAIMSRNSISAVAYFDIPANRVVELGTQIEL